MEETDKINALAGQTILNAKVTVMGKIGERKLNENWNPRKNNTWY